MNNNIFIAPILLFGAHPTPYMNTGQSMTMQNLSLPIETVINRSNDISSGILKYTIPIGASHYPKIKRRLTFLSFLRPDWNGDGADVPSEQTFFNANRFIERLPDDILQNLPEENINLTPYGTIIFDFENESGELVSVEVGKEKIGFFTEFISGENIESSGEKIGVNEVPKAILPAFEKFLLASIKPSH